MAIPIEGERVRCKMRRRACTARSRFLSLPRPHACQYGGHSSLYERRARPVEPTCTHTGATISTLWSLTAAIAGLATHSSSQPSPQLASNIIHRLTFLLCPSLSSPSVHYALPFMIPFMLLAVLKIPRRARFLPCLPLDAMTDVVAQILIDGYDSLKCECGVYNVSFARPFLLPFVIFFGQAFVGHRGNDHQLFAFALSSHSGDSSASLFPPELRTPPSTPMSRFRLSKHGHR